MAAIDRSTSERLFRALGDLLREDGLHFDIVVVGGVALALGGHVDRATLDVDVLALGGPDGVWVGADPLPAELRRAAERVARDFGLPRGWLDGAIGAQLAHGLPPGLAEELTWLEFGGLRVGLAGRRALIALKLFAATDQGPGSKHVHDLVALAPSPVEWDDAVEWVVAQDIAPEFPASVRAVVRHVQSLARTHPR